MFSLNTKIAMTKAVITKKSPFYIQFYISKYCNLKCGMCNIVQANRDLKPFSNDQIEKIADNLVQIGAGVVLLTGGEPFLRPDIDEIVRIFKNHKLDVRMQTAGLRTDRDKIVKCVENGARDINVSLDTLDEKLADQINGVEGSWREALKTISFISRTFPRKNSVCALGCVLSKYNIGHVEQVLDFATKIGWWLSLVPVHITSKEKPMNFRGYNDSFMFQKRDFPKVKTLIERLKKKKRQGYMLFDSDDYLDSIYDFIVTGRPTWRHNGICDSPNLYFAILPDGRVAPCCDFRMKSNIWVYDEKFPSIYKSRKFRKEIAEITGACTGCNFGSFPEMTLSARSLSTVTERLMLQFKAKSYGIKPISEEEIFEIVKEVRGKSNGKEHIEKRRKFSR